MAETQDPDVARARQIAKDGLVTVPDLITLADGLRDRHIVGPIAPMLAAAARRALDTPWGNDHQILLAKLLRDHQQFRFARRVLRDLRERERPEDRELIRQQLALCTYKDVELPALRRLGRALEVLKDGRELTEVKSGETLGIASAIYKRKWELDARQADLERALWCGERGFALGDEKERWYPAINAAFVADRLAELARREEEAGFGTPGRVAELRAKADVIRRAIVDEHPRHDDVWTAATLGEAYFGLGEIDEALPHLKTAGDDVKHLWQRETAAMQLAALARLRDVEEGRAKQALAALVHDRAGAVRRAGTGKVGLALSGGGFRASLFHLGVLARLAECGALRRVEVLSCVSGGSIVGAFYYLKLRERLMATPDRELDDSHYVKLVGEVIHEFHACVRKNLRRRLFTGPRETLLMLTPLYSRTDRVADLLDELFYSKIPRGERAGPWRMSDLMITPCEEPEGFSLRYENWLRKAQVPMLVINATTLNTGHSWQFTPSWMGEPPAGSDEPVDATRRLRRIYYDSDKEAAPDLSTAVGASACVPLLFPPVKLPGLYEDIDVELVDGGVHDNQGVASLVEQDCAVLLVSDASGLLGDRPGPRRNLYSVGRRTQSVLMSRVRGAQITELAGRQRAGALRGLMMVHLKKGIPAPPRDSVGCPEPYDPDDDPLATGPHGPGYGIHPAVQRALSELRTDLDRFSDAEAYGLMAAGYAMSRVELDTSVGRLFPPVQALVDNATWPFLSTLARLDEPRTAHALQPGMFKTVRRAKTAWARRPAWLAPARREEES